MEALLEAGDGELDVETTVCARRLHCLVAAKVDELHAAFPGASAGGSRPVLFVMLASRLPASLSFLLIKRKKSDLQTP